MSASQNATTEQIQSESATISKQSDDIPSETSSVVSVASSGIRKPSGLKLPTAGTIKSAIPSKIGRICSNQQPKAAVPVTPVTPPKCK